MKAADRPVPPDPAVPRLLVIKLADLGDALTITPALRALRTSFPRAIIDALVTPVGASVLAGLDSIDRLLIFEKAAFDRLPRSARPFRAAFALGWQLRRARYDRVFLLHHLFTPAGRFKYAALLAATGAPWRGGLAEDHPWFLTHVRPDHGYGVHHEADYWLDVVGLAGATLPRPRLEVAIPTSAHREAERLLASLGSRSDRPRVALYPGSGAYSLARRWAAQRFAAVGQQLARNPGAEILVVGSETERALAGAVSQAIGPSAYNLAGLTADVKTLAALLRRCALLIGNDGGVMHLAVAAAIPVVAIFGPTNHRAWGPYPVPGDAGPDTTITAVVIRSDLPCAPCMYRGFLPGTRDGCRARDCLDLVEVEGVVAAARAILAQTAARPAE